MKQLDFLPRLLFAAGLIWPGAAWAAAPLANTQPAAPITATTATLNGMASPNGVASVAWFEWSTNTSGISASAIPYSHATPAQPVGDGVGVVRVSVTLTNLRTGFPHRFRMVVSNVAGVTRGFEQHFVTGGTVQQIGGSVPAALGSASCVAVSASASHKLAQKTNGSLVVWGNANPSSNVPADLTNAVFFAAGPDYSLAVRDNGTVRGWGANGWLVLPPPSTLTNVIAVACGLYYGIALHSNGSMSVWNGSYPEFGNFPTGATNIVAITSGLYHIAALRDDGEVFLWGQNNFGQLNKPSGLSNVVAVTAGSYHTVAVRSNGTVAVWGSDNNGNSHAQTNTPSGLNDVVAASVGSIQVAALRRNGDLTGWGYQAGPLGYYRRTVALAVGGTDVLRLQSDLIPVIRVQPQGANATFGNTVSLLVDAVGSFPLLYHWSRNGASSPGDGFFRNFTATRATEGSYRVVVSNEFGQTTSDSAFVRVRVPQQITSVKLAAGSQDLTLGVSDAVGGGLAAANNLELRFATNLLATDTLWFPLTNVVTTATNGILRITAPSGSDPARYFRVVEK